MTLPIKNKFTEKLRTAINHYEVGDYEGCEKLTRCTESPTSSDINDYRLLMHLRADALIELKRYPEAILTYGKIIDKHRDEIAFANRGHCLQHEEQWERAIRDYKNALNLNPTNQSALAGVAECLLAVGKIDQAKTLILNSISNGVKGARLYKTLAICHTKSEEWILAYDAFTNSLIYDPSDAFCIRAIRSIERLAKGTD